MRIVGVDVTAEIGRSELDHVVPKSDLYRRFSYERLNLVTHMQTM